MGFGFIPSPAWWQEDPVQPADHRGDRAGEPARRDPPPAAVAREHRLCARDPALDELAAADPLDAREVTTTSGGLHVGAAVSGTAWYLLYVVILVPALVRRHPDHRRSGARVRGRDRRAPRRDLRVRGTRGPHEASRAVRGICTASGPWLLLALAWVNAPPARHAPHRADRLRGGPRAVAGLLDARRLHAARDLAVAAAATGADHHRAAVDSRRDRPPAPEVPAAGRHDPARSAATRSSATTRSPASPRRPGEGGYRMAISRAGDWTSRFTTIRRATSGCAASPPSGSRTRSGSSNRVLYVGDRQRDRSGARAPAHRHAGGETRLGHPEPACDLRRRTRRRDRSGSARRRRLGHRSPGQARCARAPPGKRS